MRTGKDELRELVEAPEAGDARRVLGIFREGFDTNSIAIMIGAPEAKIYHLLARAREDERAVR